MVDLNRKVQDTERLNAALELLHFGFRAIIAHPDQRLTEIGYSRVHHRILYFIARNPDCSIKELLEIMHVSKQYLHRPLRQLIDDGYVDVRQDDEDLRIKRLVLTDTGAALEETLTGEQRDQMERAFHDAGSSAESGWRCVMKLLAKAADN
ncbi:MarR family winged helix-turn-helix transcriptional regulator [Thiolapillus sp.]